MTKNSKILAIIPARGGSKGLPGKNIADLAGKPLIVWTIDAALKSQSIDRLIVSTDDQEIAKVAEKYGAEVPWMRSAELATDDSPVIMTVIDTLKRLEKEGYFPDYVMLLQTTSPLRTAEDIDKSANLAFEKNADTVIGVCEAKEHPYLAKKINEYGQLENFMDLPTSITQTNRQNYPPVYTINGTMYIVKTKVLLEKESFYGDNVIPYLMPQERSIDIDTPWDMQLAGIMMQNMMNEVEI